MARGFESKSVADQQESALEERRPGELGDPIVVTKRRRLELARADVQHRLETVRADVHREMLQRALAALDKELGEIH